MAFPKSRILSVQQLIQQMQESNRNGERFCFVLGSGASVSSKIPSGGQLEMTWMNCIMGEEKDDETPPMDANIMRECAKKLYDEKRMGHEFEEIEEAWKKAKREKKESMPSKYYFDLYRLRFYPNQRNGYRYLERIMENCEPSLGYRVLALLLTKSYLKPQDTIPTDCDRNCAAKKKDEHSNQNNLVITTNFDSLTEDALFIYSDKKPLVVSHESLAAYIDSDIQRPVVAKVHRGLMYDPLNSPDETKRLKKEWREALNYAFGTYTPIVIGYGGGDGSLMSFLEAKNTPIRHGLYWCYVGNTDQPPEDERIQKLVKKVKDGCFVAIEGFDELMVDIGKAFYNEEAIPDGTEAYLEHQYKERVDNYSSQYNDLLSKKSKAIKNLDILQQAKEEQREKAGELTAEDYFRRGIRAYIEGDFPKAIEEYSKAIELDPDDAEAYNNRGVTYASDGKYNEAIEEFNKAIELDPNLAAAYNNRGNAYDDLKQYEEAIADYSKAIELKPDYAWGYLFRGFVYTQEGKSDEAIADFSKAIELDPNNAEAYYNRGNAYRKQGKYNEAIADYNKAIELDPDDAEAYYNRGNAYGDLKQYDKAIADYNKAIELDLNDAVAYNNRGLVYKKWGKPDEAIADFNKAIELDPNDAAAYNNRGVAYYELEQWDEAIADYNKAIELKPDYAAAYNNRGVAYYELEQWDEAIADLSKAIELKPDHAGAYANRGEACCKLEDYEAAIRDCSMAIELGSDDLDALITAHTYRAQAYRAIGQIDLAEADEKRAEELRNQKEEE